jgi:hypothetical protein
VEWSEINCIISALEALIEKYETSLKSGALNEDDRSDVSNDLAYAEILKGKYEEMRTKAAG